jgi:hypothetical protein
MNMTIEQVTYFRCPQCRTEHTTLKAAEECLAQGFESHIKVGDIVVGNRKYGWVEGDDPQWIYDQTNDIKKTGSHLEFGYRFWFVAVAVLPDFTEDKSRQHYPVIHYVTRAMRDQGRHASFSIYYGRGFYKDGGYYTGGPLPILPEKPKENYDAFHPPIKSVPARIRREAAELIEAKECGCSFKNEHKLIGWETLNTVKS